MLTMFRRRNAKTVAERDAGRLMEQFGDQAFSAAGEMSWREDAGLLASPQPGHWHRVQQEIGRRQAPAATPQRRLIADHAAETQSAGLR